MAETFTCAYCRKTYPKVWSDDDVQAEYETVFGALASADKAVVCDDCYQAMLAAYPVASYATDYAAGSGGDPG